MKSKTDPKPKRNTHLIGFNDEEFDIIQKKAQAQGLYPRQLIMLKVKGK